jgi:NAD(P)-dependent dehydrogenase (short-subunit alcohol dehydrogenase family)
MWPTPAAGPAVSETILRLHGRLDVAFANAGINAGDSDIEQVKLEAWQRIMAVNVTGTMLTCQHSIALMKQNPGGSSGAIIVNSSVTGMVGLPGDVTYTTSKGAVRLLAKSVALYCARQKLNIRCNSIHPASPIPPSCSARCRKAAIPPQRARFSRRPRR